jgi:hypothetical protein
LFNVTIAGLILFTQPGIWNALNSQWTAFPTLSGSIKTDISIYQKLAQEANRNLTL